MKKVLRIKWEAIMTLILFGTTIYGWIVYSNNAEDVKVLALACITTFMFVMIISCYQTIKNIRQEILKMY